MAYRGRILQHRQFIERHFEVAGAQVRQRFRHSAGPTLGMALQNRGKRGLLRPDFKMPQGAPYLGGQIGVAEIPEDIGGVPHHVPTFVGEALARRSDGGRAEASNQADEREAVRGSGFFFQTPPRGFCARGSDQREQRCYGFRPHNFAAPHEIRIHQAVERLGREQPRERCSTTVGVLAFVPAE
jgi:hypothetical protein